MTTPTKDELFRAGGFRIEDWVAKPALNQLIHADGARQINPKAMEVLVMLAGRPGEVISRDEFLASVWGETFVSDQVLANAIWELRRAFGDAPRSPRFIATVPKRGYRLLPPVLPVENGRELRRAPRVGGDDASADGGHPFDPDETASAGFGELAPPHPAPATGDRLPLTALIGGGAALLGALAGVTLALTLALRGAGPVTAEDEALVVAILPFENSTGDDGLEWLVSAIPDVLNHELSSSRHLYVLDAFRPGAAAEPGHDAAAKAERRGAQVLVSGRVTGDADGLRVYGRYAPPGGDAAHFEVSADEPAALFEALADRLRLALEVEAADEDGTAIAATGTSSIDAYRHYIQAIGLARRQDHGGALAQLHRALDADPSFALAHGELAHLYDVQGQDDLAMESVTRALELAADRPQAERVGLRRLRARIAGELGEELDALRQAVALRPRDARWIATLAWFQFTHFRQCEEAAVRYRRALELDPRPDLYAYLGEAEMACGRPGEALGALERALELQENNAETWRFYARLQSLAGDRAGAGRSIERALALAPERATVALTHARLLADARRHDDALAALRRHRGLASGVNPEREGWVAEVQIHRLRGDLDAADRAVEQALSLGFAPTSSWAAGLVELDRGDVDAAVTRLAELESHFSGLESRYGLEYLEHLRGEILLRRGEPGPAADAFARAVAARPLEQAAYRRALARAWLDAGDPEEASGVLYRLLEIKPNDADAHCLSADAHDSAGRAQAARLEEEACRTLRAELGAAAG